MAYSGLGGIDESLVTKTQRARELYKYFQPPELNISSSQWTSPHSVLSAHAQLVAWRMDTRRALVSLIDQDTQYFVAESSKTISLDDESQYDDPKDAIWAGCINVPKSGRLCEHTITATPPQTGGPAYFEVLDLEKDPRFNTLPFVTGDPHFRYYCGVPLITKRGIPIGSLFAIDDRVKEPATESKIAFLATMAENCMSHLETTKEKDDIKRARTMNECLAAFVDPENRVWRRKRKITRSNSGSDSDLKSSASVPKSAMTESQKHGVGGSKRKVTTNMRDNQSVTSDTVSQSSFNSKRQTKAEDDDTSGTFRNAADLLCRSLSLEPGSGVLFLDTGTSFHSHSHSKSSSDESSDEDPFETVRTRKDSAEVTTHVSYKSWTGSNQKTIQDKSRDENSPSEIIAYRAILAAKNTSPIENSSEFTTFSKANLEKMIKKYPRGMLFNIEEEEVVASSSSGDEHTTYQMPKTRSVVPTKGEIGLLHHHFPKSRQVVFVPFWNPTYSRHSVFLAYNNSSFRTFEKSPEFLHCIAFCHSITTELTRIATLASDQQKSDFIGSVSHELRSPLHGILASCEFLDDTELSSFQKSLVDTADSCARTLLDTINMVLDYSKINAFERSANRARRAKHRRNIPLSTTHLQPALNIYGDVDLAAITEEVVEGVATGQVFKDRLADVDVMDLPPESRLGEGIKQDVSGSESPPVEIILDVSPRNWTFLTQPGAFRRVVMNVFGNSLKYTKQGFIQVKLESELSMPETKDSEEIHIITLSIKDTGQGISPQYMKSKLFTPFSQESSVAPGTGLGLSLVRSIVRMLNGEIDIQSTVGVGTEVIIKFPMVIGRLPNDDSLTSKSTPPSSGSLERTKDESLKIVQSKAKGRTAGYFCLSGQEKTDALRITRDAVNHYLKQWYCFELVNSLSAGQLPDIIVISQADLSQLVATFPNILDDSNGPLIIVVSLGAYWKVGHHDASTQKNIEPISFPFGPYKLARIVRMCLDKLDARSTPDKPSQAKGFTLSKLSEREELSEVVQAVEQVKLHGDVNVVQQGQMMANEEFAPMMVEAMSAQSSRSIEQSSGFPFPPADALQHSLATSTLEAAVATPLPKTPAPVSPGPVSSHTHSSPLKQPPRLLLVDDNKVNLRLLNAFMQKRKYEDVHLAEDGAAAVSIYNDLIKANTPPDIIFMDISMPVMNGFEAARHIREIESQYRDSLSPLETPPTTMIIALTGLASGRDQSEAFTSGFDLYLVKPISFKSVAKLLDGWERNGGAATIGVPHGSVSEEDVRSGQSSENPSRKISPFSPEQ